VLFPLDSMEHAASGDKKMLRTFCIAFLLLNCLPAPGASCPSFSGKAEDVLLQIEHAWAKALDQRDAATVGCILADNFEDLDIDGAQHNRAEMLARIPQRPQRTNQLDEMQPHVYGNAGYVRGLNTVLDAQGKVIAKVRFTDIFVYQDGQWLAVAGQEVLVKEPSK